jgi:3-hydroxyisobutyrate dehydrogenase-like beta-hydroxyacid dehydrogenase
MTNEANSPTTVLGLGEMGQALAAALLAAGVPTTVWNRTAAKAGTLARRGATVATAVDEAVAASPLVVACLLDHGSVHEVLDPVAGTLTGRSLLNLTTTTPNQARELAGWAAAAGMASLYDLAVLSGMYVTFAGFLHGAAMVGSRGVSATEFAALAAPFLGAMTESFADFAQIVDRRDYAGDGQQSLEFSDLSDIISTSAEEGVAVDVIAPVQELIRRQIAAGHGKQGFARIYEELRRPA